MSDSDKENMTNRLTENIKEQSTWIRGFFMLVFMVIYGVSKAVLIAVVVFQFISRLLTRQTNTRLQVFSRALAAYLYQIALYLTYNSEEQPFPFGEWPAADLLGGAAVVSGGSTKPRRKQARKAVSTEPGAGDRKAENKEAGKD